MSLPVMISLIEFKKILKKVVLPLFFFSFFSTFFVFLINFFFKGIVFFYLPAGYLYSFDLTIFLLTFPVYQDTWLTKLESYKHFSKIKQISKFFLFILIVLIFCDIFFSTSTFTQEYYLDKFFSLNSIISFLYFPTIILGYFVLWTNHKMIENKIESEYKEKTPWYITFIILTATISIFVAVKYPYMGLDFSGYHDMKYSSYVEPVLHMVEKGPLHNERRYIALPVILEDGTYSTFGYYPLMEWGLYGTFKLFPSNSVELNTRLFTAFLGVLLIVSLYYLLSYFQKKRYIVLVLFLFSINTIVQFITFVTVYDLLLLIFFFWSLALLLKGIKEQKEKIVYISGVVAGIGVNLKYALLVYLFPVALLFLVFYKRTTLKRFFTYGVLFVPNLILQTLYFRMSIRHIPEGPRFFGGIFLFLLFLNILLYAKTETLTQYIEKFYDKLVDRKILLIYILPVVIAGVVFVLLSPQFAGTFTSDFVTDKYLILNWSMYEHILMNIKGFLTPTIFNLGLLFFPTIFFIKNDKLILLNVSLFTTSVIYLILTSKVLYFHEYYLYVFIITGIVSASAVIYYFYQSYPKYFGYILIFFMLLSTLPSSVLKTQEYLSRKHDDVEETGKFLNEHLNEKEFFILNQVPTTITFYADRKSFSEDTLAGLIGEESLHSIFKTEIEKSINITDVMKSNGIKYYVINKNYGFSKVGFASLYDNTIYTKLDSISFRTRMILCKENDKCVQNENIKKINAIFSEKVAPYLKLEKQFGDYQIYKFEENTLSSSSPENFSNRIN